MRFATGVYRLLLLAYPRSFRRRFADSMTDTFVDDLANARRGGGTAAWKVWMWAIADAVRFGTAERLEAVRRALRRGRAPEPGHSLERSRDSIVATIIQDIRYAIRGFRKAPGFALLAALTLALGVGANTSIFSLVNGVVLRPLPYERPDEIVTLWGIDGRSKDVMMQVREASSLEGVAGYSYVALGLIGVGEAEEIPGLEITPNHFAILSVPPALGRIFTEEEGVPGHDPVVILSHDLWQARFGADDAVVGKRIQLGSELRTIVGVMPAAHQPLIRGTRFWIPKTVDPSDFSDYAGTAGTSLVARLAPGATLESAGAEVRGIAGRLRAESPEVYSEEWVAASTPEPLHRTIVGDAERILWVLLGAVGFVLLIACTNVANLLLARAGARRHEIAVRTALGASRGRVVRQLLTESTLLGLVGGALGVGAAALSMTLLVQWLPRETPRLEAIAVDGRVLAVALVVSLLAGLSFGLAPAFRATRQTLQGPLGDSSRSATSGRGRHRFQNGLVATEIALSVVLVVAAGLMLKSFWKMQSVDLGFHADEVLTMRLSPPPSRYTSVAEFEEYYRGVQEEVGAVPGVLAVGAVSGLPMSGGQPATLFRLADVPEDEDQPRRYSNFQFVTPGYLRSMGIPLVAGRWLEDSDRQDAPMVGVVNQTMAREAWGDEDPIGRRLQLFGHIDLTVVGVVGDAHQFAPNVEIRPEVYFSATQLPWASTLYLTVHTDGDPADLIASVKSAVWSVDADVPVSRIRPMEDVVAGSVAVTRFVALLLGGFGALALVLASLGVYGVMSYVAGQRTQEIGIRLALGADANQVVRASMLRGMLPVAVGLVLGIAGAVASTRLLSRLLFEVEATDLATFAVLPVLLALVAAAAVWLPARRAASVDPLVALNTE